MSIRIFIKKHECLLKSKLFGFVWQFQYNTDFFVCQQDK